MGNSEHSQTSRVVRGIVVAAGAIAVVGFLYVAAVVMFFLFVGGGEWG